MSALMINGIHHVAIRAKDIDASIRFYTEVLGCTLAAQWGEGPGRIAMLTVGKAGQFVEIFAGGNEEAKADAPLVHIAFDTPDVDAAIECVRAAGAEIACEPTTVNVDSKPKPMSIRLAFCKGPDGEVIEFFRLESS